MTVWLQGARDSACVGAKVHSEIYDHSSSQPTKICEYSTQIFCLIASGNATSCKKQGRWVSKKWVPEQQHHIYGLESDVQEMNTMHAKLLWKILSATLQDLSRWKLKNQVLTFWVVFLSFSTMTFLFLGCRGQGLVEERRMAERLTFVTNKWVNSIPPLS